MSADSIQLIIDYVNGNIKVVSKEAEEELGKSGEKGGKKFSDNFEDASRKTLATIGKIATAAAAVGSVALFKSVKDAAQLEVINTQFEVMLKSASAAQAQVEELQEFAASTPFQLTGLSEATKQLLSFGVAQKEIVPTLQQLGDIAAGVGADITDLTIPFGRLVSTQKLTLQELDKFADRGVNIYAELANQTGRSLKTIRDDISRGRVPFEEFTKALTNLTGENGLFFEGMEKQSKTLTGTISTLGDNLFNLSANFGKAFSPLIIEGANKFIKVLQDLNKQVTENFNVFDDVVNPMLAFNSAFITYVIAPFEQLKNVGDVVFDSVALGLNSMIEGVSVAGLKIAQFLNKFGLESDAEVKQWEDRVEVLAGTSEQLAGDLANSLENIADFSISDGLEQKNEDLRVFFQNQRSLIEEENLKSKDQLAKNIEDAANGSSEVAVGIAQVWEGLNFSINNSKEQVAKTAAETANIIKGTMVKGISGGIQNIVNSLAKGEDVFASFGSFILGLFGDLAIQLGQFWIAKGIAITAAEAVSGTGAIVAGASLVAVGQLMKSFAGSGGGSSASSSGGGGASTPSFASSNEPTGEFVEEGAAAATPTTVVNFNVDGNIKGDADFIRDTVEGISEEGGKQGLVFNNFATA